MGKRTHVDYKFEKDVGKLLPDMKAERSSFMMRVKYLLAIVLGFRKYIMEFGMDALVAYSLWNMPSHLSFAGFGPHNLSYAYSATILLAVLIFIWEFREARGIVKSDDVSDAFIHDLSYFYWSAKSYKHFIFFKVIDESTKKLDNAALFIYFTLDQWKSTIFVEIPQLVLSLIIIYMQSGINVGSASLLDWTKGISLSTGFSVLSKFITMGLMVGKLTVALLIYPVVKCMIKGSFHDFCSNTIDKRLTETVTTKAWKKDIGEGDVEMGAPVDESDSVPGQPKQAFD